MQSFKIIVRLSAILMFKTDSLVQNSVLFYLVAVCKSQALPMLEFLKLPTSSSSFSEFVAQEMEEKVI